VNAAQTALDQANMQYALDAAPAAATDVAQAEAAVRAAQAGLDKARNPYSQQAMKQAREELIQATEAAKLAAHPFSEADLAAAQASLKAARAQLQAAEVAQQQAVVTSPINGVVATRSVGVGSTVTAQGPMFTVVSKMLQVDVAVPSEQLAQLRPGEQMQLTTPVLPGVTVAGRIESISPVIDNALHGFHVKLALANQDSSLRPGVTVTAQAADQAAADGLAIPKQAVIRSGGQAGVFVVQDKPEGSVAVFTAVITGTSTDTTIQALSGLKIGDRVIVGGLASLTNNQRVQVALGALPTLNAPAASLPPPARSSQPPGAANLAAPAG
jgi:RND family efflux transporter MFP subunit